MSCRLAGPQPRFYPDWLQNKFLAWLPLEASPETKTERTELFRTVTLSRKYENDTEKERQPTEGVWWSQLTQWASQGSFRVIPAKGWRAWDFILLHHSSTGLRAITRGTLVLLHFQPAQACAQRGFWQPKASPTHMQLLALEVRLARIGEYRVWGVRVEHS